MSQLCVDSSGVDGVEGDWAVLDQARIGFLAGVQSPVDSQIVCIAEPFVANVALVRPIRRMGHSMDAQLV